MIDASTAHRTAAGLGLRLRRAGARRSATRVRGRTRVVQPGLLSDRLHRAGAAAARARACCRPTMPVSVHVDLRLLRRRQEDDRAATSSRRPARRPQSFGAYGAGAEAQARRRDAHARAARPQRRCSRRRSATSTAAWLVHGAAAPVGAAARRVRARAARGAAPSTTPGERFVTRAAAERPGGAARRRASSTPEALNGTQPARAVRLRQRRARQALLVARLDNLGKGASGAAVQNLNLMLGLPEDGGAGVTLYQPAHFRLDDRAHAAGADARRIRWRPWSACRRRDGRAARRSDHRTRR
ncbi:MAG: hypothetical protein MZW92_35155 [Comamonadaceae bacterium]|nr:hypothetical protein [Comamonadaceae bacterium]